MKIKVKNLKFMGEYETMIIEEAEMEAPFEELMKMMEYKLFQNKSQEFTNKPKVYFYTSGEEIMFGDIAKIRESEFCVTNADTRIKYDERISGISVEVCHITPNGDVLVNLLSSLKLKGGSFYVEKHWLEFTSRKLSRK